MKELGDNMKITKPKKKIKIDRLSLNSYSIILQKLLVNFSKGQELLEVRHGVL